MGLWSAKFATGNTVVDNDHMEIFKLVEDVMESSIKDGKEKNETAINFLAQYVVGHFKREENLMAESDYPNTAAHTKEHNDFMEVAKQLKEDFDDGGYAFGELEMHPDTMHLSKVINDTVVGWLTTHVMGSDKDLADHYRKWKYGR
ncbi:MAG: bacteriohemerythrin [Defluviitaleaceae bacterium]|nr:bacteriohemerythrin [Defluviitaleaceae bacterium]MCL2262714.1 bacteriohemerythrin [Defluviitaleaceae bacterium]